MPAQTTIRVRQGTAAEWTSTNPTLAAGEHGYETDTGLTKIGNGTLAWNSLGYIGAGTKYETGFYYSTPGTRSTATRNQNVLTLLPFRVESAHTFTGIAVDVTGAGQAGSLLRLAVYTGTPQGVPSTLLIDAGTVAGDGATGVKAITGLSIPLRPGYCFLGVAFQSAATTRPTVRTLLGNVPGAPLVTTNFSSGSGWTVTGASVSGALPSSISPSLTDTAAAAALIA
jgi:hypothetical protein